MYGVFIWYSKSKENYAKLLEKLYSENLQKATFDRLLLTLT